MSIEEDIQALLAEAEPLRALAEDDPRTERLARLIDKVNALRAIQAKENERLAMEAMLRGDEPSNFDVAFKATNERKVADLNAIGEIAQPKRGPGRPKKEAQ